MWYLPICLQWRAAISESNWEKEEDKIKALTTIADMLVDSHRYKEVKKEDLYASKMLLQTTIKRLETLIDANNVTASSENKSALLTAYMEVRDSLKGAFDQMENIQSHQ